MKSNWSASVTWATLLFFNEVFIRLPANAIETNSILAIAQSNQQPVQATHPTTSGAAKATTNTFKPPQFPTEFTNRAGVVYRNIRVQQAYTDGVLISYVDLKNVRALETIRFTELSPELQKYYGYDSKNSAAFKERQRQLRDYNDAIWRQKEESEKPKREAELRKLEEAKEAER